MYRRSIQIKGKLIFEKILEKMVLIVQIGGIELESILFQNSQCGKSSRYEIGNAVVFVKFQQ